jgi:hypothetical protein
MKSWHSLFIALTLFVMVGCIPIIHALYTEKDLILVPEIEGSWYAEVDEPNSESKDMEMWHFELLKNKHYQLTHISKGHKAEFEARFLKLNGTLFLDLYPESMPDENYLYELHVYPMHTVSRIQFKGDQFHLEMLEGDWINKKIESNELDIEHTDGPHDTKILTAKTPELQAFFGEIGQINEAWGEPLELQRSK